METLDDYLKEGGFTGSREIFRETNRLDNNKFIRLKHKIEKEGERFYTQSRDLIFRYGGYYYLLEYPFMVKMEDETHYSFCGINCDGFSVNKGDYFRLMAFLEYFQDPKWYEKLITEEDFNKSLEWTEN